MRGRILEDEVMLAEDEVVAYDKLVKQYLEILHAGFVHTILNLSPEEGLFLDVGTGTGWIAIGIVQKNPLCRVVAVDLSDTMLRVAKKNAVREGVAHRIEFVKADAVSLPFTDKYFHSVFSHNMLHHLPEPILMMKEIARVVRDDGAVNVRDLKRLPFWMAKLHVNLFGLFYNRTMKKEYFDSILASLSEGEWQQMAEALKIDNARLTTQFVTHIALERPSKHKRESPLADDNPFGVGLLRNLYVSGRKES